MLTAILRFFGFVPSFDSIVSSLTSIQTQLQQHAEHHDAQDAEKTAEAARLFDDAREHRAQKRRAVETAERVAALIA